MSGEKNARACDSCIGKRARWYCAADDAFLCQSCDASVHSANPLARRHERVRLKVETNTKDTEKIEGFEDVSVPSWLQGFKRKARSPRKPPGKLPTPEEPRRGVSVPVVPELGSGETSQEDNGDEQGIYMVPVYDPIYSEVRTSYISEEPAAPRNAAYDAESKEVKAVLAGFGQEADDLDGILPSEEDLADFAADVESLLGGGIGGECHGMEGLGMTWHSTLDVKMEEEADLNVDSELAFHAGSVHVDIARESFEMNYDHNSPAEKEEIVKKRKILLNLDYESVIMAWTSQRSPWTNGCRPELLAGEECWPGICLDRHVHGGIGGRVMSQQAMGGREARVTRYREKRRTRLFSKKIRYEVRKLNAEKRPRMKGRFVKRSQIVNEPLLDV